MSKTSCNWYGYTGRGYALYLVFVFILMRERGTDDKIEY